jgi:hypothetical protein
VESHISRKTSEIWGTQAPRGLFAGRECKFAVLMQTLQAVHN